MPLDAIKRDDHIVEDWPDPEDEDYEDEDDWNDYVDADEGSKDYEVRFKLIAASEEEVNEINRYLFDVISKELEIPYSKLEDLEIEED